MSSIEVFYEVFLMTTTEVMGLGEEDHRSKVPSSLDYIKCTCYQHELSLMILTLVNWLSWVFIRFLR